MSPPALRFASIACLLSTLAGCESGADGSAPAEPRATGGVSSAAGGQAGGSSTGGSPAIAAGGDTASSGAGVTGGAAPVTPTGGVTSGGASGSGGTPGTVAGGGAAAQGSSAAGGGGGSSGGEPALGPPSYALPPPSQCHNQDYIDYQEGCIEGDASSTCGGKCNTINACLESSAEKPHADTTFICPRFMLFSDAMLQAAKDDGNDAFRYAVVGHDVDRGGIDGTAESTCCQCYQLVFAYPGNDRQALANPDDPNNTESAILPPPPVIAQSFNTAATPTTFDIYMAGGGFGANNACAPGQNPAARSGKYLYSAYPDVGQPSQGGVKPASLFQECKTETNWVTTASLSSEACRSRIEATCSEFASDVPGLAEQATRSCLESNDPDGFYHLNWVVYARKVECPEHLTQVTGCKLAPQGLPEVARDVTTAAQALEDPTFYTTSSNGGRYETTTMEDCCRPSCAATDWISKKGLVADADYNAFYSCDAAGVPITE